MDSKGLLTRSRREERACNSAYACRDGEMLVVEPNAWAGGRAVCAELQELLEFLSSLSYIA